MDDQERDTMAEESGGLETLDEEITCPICQEHFNDPKILPCCHYYCRDCIQLMADKAGPDRPFSCPECRKDTLLPEGGIDRFPAAFFVNRMKDAYLKMEKAHGKVEALCEMCSGGKVEAFCRQCTDFICAECVKSHKKLKVFSGHSVVTLDELKEGGTRHLHTDSDMPPLCKEHEEPLKIFCFDCNCLICRDCIVIDHAGHKYEFVKKSATRSRTVLQESVVPLRQTLSSVSKVCEDITSMRTEVSAQGNAIAKTIKDSFRELSGVLERRETELLNKTSNLVHCKLQALSAQEKTLKAVESEVQGVLDLVRQSSDEASDEELMTVQSNLLFRVEEERRRCETVGLEIVEDANLTASVLPTETMDRLCRDEMGVYLLSVDPLKCSIDSHEAPNVGEPSRVKVHTAYITGQPSCGKVKIEAELQPPGSTSSSSSVRVNVTCNSRGVYELVYIPESRGHHQLFVTVDDKPIVGSPVSIFVRMPPTKLGLSSKTLEGLRKPWGVVVTKSSEVLITEWKANKVSVFNVSGQRLEAITANCFYAPMGIAVDTQERLYVTDGTNTLFKLDRSGQVLNSVKPKDFQFSEPAGVLVTSDGQVYVCDRGNHRIAVFTSDLTFSRTLGKRGTGVGEFNLPEDIAQDRRTGKFYISDYENHRIHALTPDEQFLATFGADHLEAPNGLCVDSRGHLYVSDFRKGCIVVFSVPSCKFVANFCLPGPEEGNPSGLAIDEDGFLYACDFFNRRVVVF